ncbi:MAG: TetR/AcrR family transcriptional regulator [Lachnospiraceae bacterium]|nr:TetR/AcrR family transcriptional regulator [Lachnospiraceae bacterium]
MGKAFTDEERKEAQERLRRTGLRLFREKGIKGVSIRELTSAASISQGGFYTFYKNKYDFLIDITEFRIREKLAVMAKEAEGSSDDPVAYLAEQMYTEGMRLTENLAFDDEKSGTLSFYFSLRAETADRIRKHYMDYLQNLFELWRKRGYKVEADAEGLLAAVRTEGVLIANASRLDGTYLPQILKVFCESTVDAFVSAVK